MIARWKRENYGGSPSPRAAARPLFRLLVRARLSPGSRSNSSSSCYRGYPLSSGGQTVVVWLAQPDTDRGRKGYGLLPQLCDGHKGRGFSEDATRVLIDPVPSRAVIIRQGCPVLECGFRSPWKVRIYRVSAEQSLAVEVDRRPSRRRRSCPFGRTVRGRRMPEASTGSRMDICWPPSR